MAERKIASSAELNVWLTGEIRSVAGCEQCELTWKYRLREPEKHGGCNWSSINLRFGEDSLIQSARFNESPHRDESIR